MKLKLIINDDSCNGEAAEFSAFVHQRYPRIEVVHEDGSFGGLYYADGSPADWPDLWDEYCNA